jgi:hypothetical protein
MEVLGASNVVVLDAENANVSRPRDGQVSTGRDLRMHVLAHGMTLDLPAEGDSDSVDRIVSELHLNFGQHPSAGY